MSQNISKIFYINLNKRTDRRILIETELNDYGLCNYERFEAIETPSFGAVGCAISHLSVLKIAKNRHYENVLILEDDFTFLTSKTVLENNLHDFFNLKIPFDVCMLSYNIIDSEPTIYNCISKIKDAQTASGYIVNQNYYDKLISLYEWAIPLLETTKEHWVYANDQIWKQLQKKDNWYYFNERIGRQRPGYSDNGQCYSDNKC